METAPQKQPEYSQALLIRLVHETKDIRDLLSLTTLISELEEQGDIYIGSRLYMEMKAQHHFFKYNFNINNSKNKN